MKAGADNGQRLTYFGDAAWDQQACKTLGCNFVLVGDRIHHTQSVSDLSDVSKIWQLLDL